MAAGARVLEARATLGVAIGEFYPQTAADRRRRRLQSGQPGRPDARTLYTSSENFWRASLGTQVAWELDFWGKFRRGVQSADAAYLASIATYDDVLVTLLGDVASTYIGIRTLQAQIAIARENVVKQQKALADRARPLPRRRRDRSSTCSRPRTCWRRPKSAIPQLTAQLQQGENALRVLLGMAPALARCACSPARGHPGAAAATSRSASPPICCAAGPTCAPPNSTPRRRARRSALPRPICIRRSPSTGAFGTVAGQHRQRPAQPGLHRAEPSSSPSARRSAGRCSTTGRSPTTCGCRTRSCRTLLIDYQNTVLKAQQEVENGLAAFVQGRRQVDYCGAAWRRPAAPCASPSISTSSGTRDFTTVLTAEQNLYQAQSSLASASGSVATSLDHRSTGRSAAAGRYARATNS